MARKSTIKLLLTTESDNESERLISVFRNAGRVARAERADSLESLRSLLENQQWDLLIADDKHPEIAIEQVLEQLRKTALFLPVIAVSDRDPAPLMEAGASDVVSQNTDRRLVLTAFRELQHLDHYRQLQALAEKLTDAEERSALLMAQSQDAIAYVSDGMLVNCNSHFAERFGYSDPEDLDCAPVIDLIESGDHEKFKGLLKAQLTSGEGSTQFAFTGRSSGGDTFAASMQLSSAVYDDEPCVQLSVRDSGAGGGSSDGGGNSDIDYLTQLYSAPYFAEQLESAIKQAAASAGNSTLLLILIDQFAALRSRIGLSSSGELVARTAETIRNQCGESACLAHYSDDTFTLLLERCEPQQVTATAQAIIQRVAESELSFNDQTIRCKVSIGIAAVDGQADQTQQILIDGCFQAAAKAAGEAGGIATYTPERQKKALGDAGSDADLDKILEEALEDNQCFLVFEPVVSLRGASGDHYEVQTHLIDADGTEIDADQFLSSLHFSGVNTRLDRWILLESSKQLAAQIAAGNDTRLFINLTANSLRDEGLIPWLGVALKAGGIPAHAIALQFREQDLLKHQTEAQPFIKSLKGLGCRLSITAFGTAENPTATLDKFAPQFTKICHNHTQSLLKGGDSGPIKQLAATSAEHSAQSIIDGVENAAALAQLWQIGVDFIQGGYLAGPSRQMDYEFTDIA